MLIASAVQYRPKLAVCRADVSQNIRNCLGLIELARNQGSQFIVFPELAFTGYSFLNKEEVYEIAENLSGPTFRTMKSIALELQAYITYGYPEIEKETLYNSAVMISPGGQVVMNIRKCNLWGTDYFWATSSNEKPKVVKTEIGNISTVICRDIRGKYPNNIPKTAGNNEIPFFKGMKLDIVAAPANWGKGGLPSVSWMDFVADNQCTLVVANRWGEETSFSQKHGEYIQDFGHGGSLIIEKNWSIHKNGLHFNEDCLVTACLGGSNDTV